MGDGPFSQKLLAALPADPFEQLEMAQRLVSYAAAAGVSKLEAETGQLRQKLDEKDSVILSMQHRLVDLEQSLEDTTFRLSQALESQLEMFKKNLLQSLQEDDDSVKFEIAVADGRDSSVIPRIGEQDNLHSMSLSTTVSDPALTVAHSDNRCSRAGDQMTPIVGRGSETVFRQSEVGMQAKGSFSPSFKSLHSSKTPFPGPMQKVDGKEFFRQARNRLSYHEFSAFLSNIKELNSHRQSREETLKKAYQIFGPDNQDLYYGFQGLITHTGNT